MQLKKYIGLLLLLIWASRTSAQEQMLPTMVIDQSAQFFEVDRLNQIYLVTAQNQLIKYDASGKRLFDFSDQTLGELTHIDVTDPFNVLLYYADYQTIVLLDRTLSIPKQLSLLDLDLFNVNVVALSRDNHIWLYDNNDFRLKKYNEQGRLLAQSVDLSLLLNVNLNPIDLKEVDGTVYLNDAALGILTFDLFGQFSSTIAIKGLQNIQIIDNKLIYEEDGVVKLFHLISNVEQILFELNKDIDLKAFRMNEDFYFVLSSKSLKVWKW